MDKVIVQVLRYSGLYEPERQVLIRKTHAAALSYYPLDTWSHSAAFSRQERISECWWFAEEKIPLDDGT